MATATQRLDLRLDLGLDDDETVLDDAAVDRLFVRAAVAYTDDASVEAYARVLACRQLRAQAANLTDYTQNESSEKLSQVFAQLGKLQTMFEADLAAAQGANRVSVRIGALKKKPSRLKEWPDA